MALLFCGCAASLAAVLPLPKELAKPVAGDRRPGSLQELLVVCSRFLFSFPFFSAAKLFTWMPYGSGSLSSWAQSDTASSSTP